jgi:hypothetical protein
VERSARSAAPDERSSATRDCYLADTALNCQQGSCLLVLNTARL